MKIFSINNNNCYNICYALKDIGFNNTATIFYSDDIENTIFIYTYDDLKFAHILVINSNLKSFTRVNWEITNPAMVKTKIGSMSNKLFLLTRRFTRSELPIKFNYNESNNDGDGISG